MSPRLERRGDAIAIELAEAERELLRRLPDELRGIYEDAESDDAVRRRLFPRAYLDPTEEGAEEEWQNLVHPELLGDRLAALERVVDMIDGAAPARRGALAIELGPDDVGPFLGMLNDARLAIGTRLGVTEDTDLSQLDPDDPDTYGHAVYTWLTHLEGELVETLLADLPD